MQPIEDLLHRIKWDPSFSKGSFTIGYYDRIADREELVPFDSMVMDPDQPKTFTLLDERGVTARIPLHRVHAVYRDGVVIWRRPQRRR